MTSQSYEMNRIMVLHKAMFDEIVKQTIAMIFINNIFIPFLQAWGAPIIIIIERDQNDENRMDYIQFEDGESLDVQSDWED